ncbi:MAG: cobyric acid synthase [Desulfovibrio sp.]|jgi:adenosylcobyric acid synthase|nr:cobyric acid synthase [Desulfovibrio sp.]
MRSAAKNLQTVPGVPALMVQGVSSNAGKSLITAALCRIFARRGLSVAPFKAQNMALNSFVTADGKEMGRAQALQAQACGVEADVRMNPVLLKPTSHAGSQIVVMGEPAGQMRAREYQEYKTTVWKAVRAAYRSLSDGKDAMVLEGAGSPAEINLKAHDIVNMRMARFADARVLLVADIDRGGAFAAVVGTMSLLGRADRARVAGYVLNKFRGDASLLEPALASVSLRTRKPFLGIVPMLADLRLPEEDSVSFKGGESPRIFSAPAPTCLKKHQCLDIVVVDLPYISNFTDLDAVRHEPRVRVRTVRAAGDMGRPDAVILPGSKNTLADLRFLRKSGLADCLCRYAGEGGTLAGICGGLQLLGETIADPSGLEEGGGESGLGLLSLHTRLEPQKQLRRVEGRAFASLAESEPAVAGYEIHHGVTVPGGGAPIPVLEDAQGRIVGWGRRWIDGSVRVWGTYLHGIFDRDGFRHEFLNQLRRKAGFALLPGIAYNIGPELDRLADAVEQRLDMKAVYSLIGKS